MNATLTKNPVSLLIILLVSVMCTGSGSALERVKYNNPGLIVDLGVGLWAWPLPMDYDSDGDYDIVASCPDKPYNGMYFFENTSGNIKMPVFKPAVRIGVGHRNIRPSYVDAQQRWVPNKNPPLAGIPTGMVCRMTGKNDMDSIPMIPLIEMAMLTGTVIRILKNT